MLFKILYLVIFNNWNLTYYFYVGVTRAKENLKILVSGQETSIFVNELLKEDIDKKYLTIRAKTTKTITYEMVKKKV